MTADADWAVAGICHALFLRALPTVRHDLLGALSAARMEAAVLRRRLQRPDPDLAQCAEQVARLDTHVGGFGEQVRLLRRWDPSHDDVATLAEVLDLAAALVTPQWRLRGADFAVELPADGPLADAGAQPAPRGLLYVLLALFAHVQDTRADVVALRVAPSGFDTLDLAFTVADADVGHEADTDAAARADDAADAAIDAPAAGALTARPIDRAAVDALLAAVGHELDARADGWRLQLPLADA